MDAFRGHGLSLLEKTTLWGLRTRAIPANVFGGASNRSPRSQRSSAPNNHRIDYSNNKAQITAQSAKEKHGDSLKKKPAFSACDVSQRSFPCPVGTEA